MSKAEILEELAKLTPDERNEVRLRLAELDGEQWLDDGELTDEEKRLIDRRLDECERNPGSLIPWEEAKSKSMIESWWRGLKHQWIYLNTLETVRAVEKRAAFCVQEHNSRLPHSAFRAAIHSFTRSSRSSKEEKPIIRRNWPS